MKIYHNSYFLKFRSPFGAVPTESTVKLALEITCKCQPPTVFVRLWQNNERLIKMDLKKSKDNLYVYEAQLSVPQKPCLIWYYFIVNSEEGVFYYSNNPCRLGGEGVMTDYPTDISYQITVFDKCFKTPDWFKNSIMYQIFPDRFYAVKTNREINKKTKYSMHKDWYEPLSFERHPYEDGPACNDFYGGNFKGIKAKLPYLKKLGISVLYLNPIFEAFSNHRYDTADYSHADPILGTNEDFAELCEECEKNGIKIILDGVFSHTGSDSIYFNKYKTYGDSVGAYNDDKSPYKKWYQWTNTDKMYESWWGCCNLPNIIETEPTYLDYILRDDTSIIKLWSNLGAYGWRLDVADELPDEFIKELRKHLKSTNPDAVIIGEVWEDASNKVSYGKCREYLLGHELDSVMNYPFKDNALKFILGDISAESFAASIMSIMENYPAESLYTAMNIVGTHDTMRLKTVLGEQENNLSFADETLALKRVRLAAFLQMTFWGVPCIYYGDEIGMEGLRDPHNRMPFTWRRVDTELLDYYTSLTALRNSMPCLRTGNYRQLLAKDGVFAYLRFIENERDAFGNSANSQSAICIVNRSEKEAVVRISIEDFANRHFINPFTCESLETDGENYKLFISGHQALIFCENI